MLTKIRSDPEKFLFIGLILSVLSTLILIIPGFQVEHISVFVIILNPILIGIGFIVSFYKKKLLRLVGWLGILLYVRCGIALVFPSEDYMSGRNDKTPLTQPNLLETWNILLRFIFVSLVIAGLIFSYRKVWTAKSLRNDST